MKFSPNAVGTPGGIPHRSSSAFIERFGVAEYINAAGVHYRSTPFLRQASRTWTFPRILTLRLPAAVAGLPDVRDPAGIVDDQSVLTADSTPSASVISLDESGGRVDGPSRRSNTTRCPARSGPRHMAPDEPGPADHKNLFHERPPLGTRIMRRASSPRRACASSGRCAAAGPEAPLWPPHRKA